MATSKIKSDSIDTVVATKLTGTVDNARISLDAAEIPNLDAAKITTGSIADARIPASAVTQHVTATDLSPIENDVAILALQNAVNANLTAHGLSNYWIEQFEDSDSVTLTDCARNTAEYVASVNADHGITMGYQHNFANSTTPATNTLSAGTIDLNSATFTSSGRTGYGVQMPNTKSSTSEGIRLSGMSDAERSYSFWFKVTGNTDGYICDFRSYSSSGYRSQINSGDYINNTTGSNVATSTLSTTAWHHAVILQTSGNGSTGITLGSRYAQETGTWVSNGLLFDNFEIYDGILNATQIATIYGYTGDVGGTASATGNITSATITPQDSASKNSLGLCLLYKNESGTNTLNTDIVAQVSCDNGSNYSTCVLASKGTFSTGINIAIAPAISCTAGTQLKYKISFANQASGSKVAQIHGVALSY